MAEPEAAQSVRRFGVLLGQSRTANGGWEWYFLLDDQRIYPTGPGGVGVFTGPETPREEAFRRVLQAWQRVL